MSYLTRDTFTLGVIVISALFLLPGSANAMGAMADAMCTPVIPTCPCGEVPGQYGCQMAGPQANKFMCPGLCWDITAGHKTVGYCDAPNHCHGTGTDGPNGFGLDQVQKILGDLMSKLMQGKPPGGGAPPPATPPSSNPSGCTLTSTNDQTLAQTNPQCYYYVAPTSASLGGTGSTGSGVGTSNISDSLLQSLGGSTSDTSSNTNTNTNVSSALSNATQATVSTSNASNPQQPIISVTQTAGSLPQANLTPGLAGNIQLLNNGGTILANNVDTGSNSAVSGFFGSDTFNGQPQGVVAGLCQTRPWASFFLSYVIPSTFFDSLCVLKGYAVGNPAPAQTPTVTVVQSAPKAIVATTSAPVVQPKVDIWASPASVTLGARTSIFWTSQGVTNCTETSPDGNFSQSTLSGGASTAPITGSTVFTISCLAPDGSHVTDNVTVNLAI